MTARWLKKQHPDMYDKKTWLKLSTFACNEEPCMQTQCKFQCRLMNWTTHVWEQKGAPGESGCRLSAPWQAHRTL
eukprot:scaffold194665_cov20-Tisochrysis_lutea.AAC.1